MGFRALIKAVFISNSIIHRVLYLYINGQLIDKFTDTITFQMWGAPITVLVTPEPVKE